MTLRRLTVLAAAAAMLLACDDDGASTPADDTATAQDGVADTVGGEDSAGAIDTVTAQDTQVAQDTVTAQDTQVAQDTSPPQDTTPVDMGEGTCPGMRACVAGCAGAADAAQCESDCLAATDSADETSSYDALEACLDTYSCDESATDDEGLKDFYECSRQCRPELAACAAGGYADGTCVEISGCVAANCMGEDDFRCQRTCMAAASAEAVSLYLDWHYCGLAECYSSTDVIAMENCIQQVRSTYTCSDAYTHCFGSTGASAGAGAGGGR